MNILALDLGTKCGWACSTGMSGVWGLKPSTHESAGERYRKFRAYLDNCITSQKITFVVYEEVHAHIGTDAAHVFGGLMAILQSTCLDYGVEYRGAAVQTIKKHGTGKGNAKKDDMIAAASVLYKKVNVLDDNHADALILLSYAEKMLNTPKCDRCKDTGSELVDDLDREHEPCRKCSI